MKESLESAESDIRGVMDGGDAEEAARWFIDATARGTLKPHQLSGLLLKVATPSLELTASLPFPERSLDLLFSIHRVIKRLTPRGAALALAQGAHWVCAAPHPRRSPPEVSQPGIAPESLEESLVGAITRGNLPLARGLTRALLEAPSFSKELGRALVAATSDDAFQGGERLLTAIAAWLLIRREKGPEALPLLDAVLPYLCSEPQDRAPAKAFAALRGQEPLPPLEPAGFESAWAISLLKGLSQSRLRRSLPRLLRPGLVKTLTGNMTLPDVASPAHLAYARALVARSAANLPTALRPLHECLRDGDREAALPKVAEIVGEGQGYGRVLRLAALVGAERMMVRRYRGGFGMAQDIRLCHGAALLADYLGARNAVPGVWLTAYVVGRGGASLGGPVPEPIPMDTECLPGERDDWRAQLEESLDGRDLERGRRALASLMEGTTSISHVNRGFLEAALRTWDPEAIAFPYTVASVGVAEHMPRLDAELVLGAALSFLTTRPPSSIPPWVQDALTKAGL